LHIKQSTSISSKMISNPTPMRIPINNQSIPSSSSDIFFVRVTLAVVSDGRSVVILPFVGRVGAGAIKVTLVILEDVTGSKKKLSKYNTFFSNLGRKCCQLDSCWENKIRTSENPLKI